MRNLTCLERDYCRLIIKCIINFIVNFFLLLANNSAVEANKKFN